MTFMIFKESSSFLILLDCKEQNEFRYDIDQILEWL